jgi:DNA-binding NarL/FixJ family response regulator
LLEGGTAGRGYLLKERISHFDELAEAVRQVASGGTVLDPLVVEALLAQPRSAATLSRLTPREREVLSELATGFSNRTVAQRLVLSQRAVEKHINAIFAKMFCRGERFGGTTVSVTTRAATGHQQPPRMSFTSHAWSWRGCWWRTSIAL